MVYAWIADEAPVGVFLDAALRAGLCLVSALAHPLLVFLLCAIEGKTLGRYNISMHLVLRQVETRICPVPCAGQIWAPCCSGTVPGDIWPMDHKVYTSLDT